MKTIQHRACGFCTEFTTKDAPFLAAQGIGTCKHGNPGGAGTTVHATERTCVLFRRSMDLAPREKFVARHQQAVPA